MREKTVILVTHQLQYLSKADKIIVLKDGKLIVHGNYDELTTVNNGVLGLIEKANRGVDEGSMSKPRSSPVLGANGDGKQIDQESCKKTEQTMAKKETAVDCCVSPHIYWKYFR